ncbi:Putative alanine racemase, D-serine dehydratase-like domain, PLP-binding barrel [Septoria linicola]|uniref:D-serine dehydratase n=1 Tax=Septoria linicola TaxID=215465 RepID=A0A9Q9B1M2_9PEZI|nr:putative alanine racemase, D-serine dehydratase-like domain, PLP-binding barrel [Septoria linicola]USW59000.1 Putative alanine racemase, D-serine dehydratase-like domain, PLP-binding barrel [Septoria linicola]
MSSPTSFLYPSPSPAALKLQFVGKRLQDVQAPAAVLDVAVVRRNCKLMLDTAAKLNVGFRAHVKTHKTTELSQYQVGKDARSIKFVASTVAEVEGLSPWLLESVQAGKEVSVLYGIPVAPSAIPRLAAVTRLLGQGTVGLFVDHPDQVIALERVSDDEWPGQIPVWIQIDVGYHREGVAPGSKQLADIAAALKDAKRAAVAGFYAHMGHSYSVSSPEEALKYMSDEIQGLEEGTRSFLDSVGHDLKSKVVLSLGATPTATSIQNLTEGSEVAKQYRSTIEKVQQSFDVEFHAGVYPVMDMQQLATRARPQESPTSGQSLLSFKDLGFRVLTEVASTYFDRGEKPEALIGGGGIVLGREPCKSYPGWAVVTPWPAASGQTYDPEGVRNGWIVGRIAQEHGILSWEGSQDNFRELKVGEKLLLWPNHACIAGVNFGWYLVVDSEKSDLDRIEDIWVRWRGW